MSVAKQINNYFLVRECMTEPREATDPGITIPPEEPQRRTPDWRPDENPTPTPETEPPEADPQEDDEE